MHVRGPSRREHCEIVSDGNFAQVSWGKAFGGNDARFKVIFERASGGWIEILRYQAPDTDAARNKSNRTRQRALWADESGVRSPAAAWAGKTS